jgi:hypothetical protein
MNYKILQTRHDATTLETYYDPESKLNHRVIEKRVLDGGSVLLVGNMPIPDATFFGYDVMICRNSKLPKSEEWGTYGWSYIDFDLAKKQFETIKEI